MLFIMRFHLLFLFLFKDLFIYFWLCWVFVAFSGRSEWQLLFVAVHGLLIAVASPVAGLGLYVQRLQ